MDRADGYLGVLIDDLVTLGVTEPYRMFTARAEYRLTLAADTSDIRLTERGAAIGCVRNPARLQLLQKKNEILQQAINMLNDIQLSPSEWKNVGIEMSQNGKKQTAFDVLSRFDATLNQLLPHFPQLNSIPKGKTASLFFLNSTNFSISFCD